jgi:hypothetical protein
MKPTEYIRSKISRLPKGYVFTYSSFTDEVNKKEAVIKYLNRLAASGKIVKLSKGKFYKPEETPFGMLQPEQSQIVKDLLEKDGKTIGYITGLGIYNMLGLTTQVSSIIQVGKNESNSRPSLKRGRFRISFIRQKNIITKENIPLLQILDAIRYIKKIPDTDVTASCKRLTEILSKISDEDITSLVRLSIKYPPVTRALLGAILEFLGKETWELIATLNPITKYKVEISGKVLPTKSNWNII